MIWRAVLRTIPAFSIPDAVDRSPHPQAREFHGFGISSNTKFSGATKGRHN